MIIDIIIEANTIKLINFYKEKNLLIIIINTKVIVVFRNNMINKFKIDFIKLKNTLIFQIQQSIKILPTNINKQLITIKIENF